VLTIYRRHSKECQHFGKGRNARAVRNCSCGIWVQGSLRGEYIRRALNLNSWEAAADMVRGWEASGEIGVVKAEIPAIREAVEKFLADGKARHLGNETLRKYENLLQRRFLDWCSSSGYRLLKQLGTEQVREFRNTWMDSPVYATKNLERVKAFFRFCESAGWVKRNAASAVKPPRVKEKPTEPFTEEELRRILSATEKYRGDKRRIRAFILTMTYSGLRISDTIGLRRDALRQGKIKLHTQKTGVEVFVPIPPFVVEALEALPEIGDRFFWNGKGTLRTRVANWSRYLASVFKISGVEDAHSHRFRHSFATALLQKGTSVENVATLLGNSPKIVHKHYAAWIKKRQEILEAEVKATWCGEVAEWLKAGASKASVPERAPGVQIPPSPPISIGRPDAGPSSQEFLNSRSVD